MHTDTSITTIANELSIKDQQVGAVAALLSDGSTIPFIARYRKEVTGSLDEVAVTAIRDRLHQLRDLQERQAAILKSLEKHGHLTDELHQKVLEAETMVVLEDIYLPFKPKRRTKAVIAKEKGLEPLAHLILEQNNIDPSQEAVHYIDPEKKVDTIEDALAGARDIIAEVINENDETRSQLRNLFFTKAGIKSRVIVGMEKTGVKFKDYFEWEESIAKVPSHRMLAMRRGEKENVLILDISPEEENAIAIMEALFVKGNGEDSAQVKLAVMDGYKRLLSNSMETETRMHTKTRADSEAIRIFAENLRQLLLSPPLGAKRVMGIDPGFRTGCKVACLDRQGTLLHHDTIYPHMSQKKALEDTAKIQALCKQFQTEAIAVGNGTAGRETEAFVKAALPPGMTQVLMVNESGASVYSASEVAREEFPDHDLTVRGAVSIGRRLMDPLAELVKIDPKSIGVGQYQHDVGQTALKQALDDVVMSCVNNVGVVLNRASAPLLTYVSGLNAGIAKNIVLYRDSNGPFQNRKQLLKVSRLGPKAFEQSAGFLRIMAGENPLDASAVHPESYAIVDAISKDLGKSVADMMKKPDLRTQIDLSRYVTTAVGIPTLNDILDELAKPGRDPRETFEVFSFTDGIEKIADLRKDMQLPGIVTNITAFGAFVDIGVHQDGLVHISQMADRFVKNPADIVKVQQQVNVTVLDVDMDRKRISLSMKKAVDPMEKSTRKKSEIQKRTPRPSRPKPDKNRKPEKKPTLQGSLAEALLKSGLK
jgi:uncharacterized protein